MYTGIYNFRYTRRGDDLKTKTFLFSQNTVPLDIASALMQIRDQNDNVLVTPTLVVTPGSIVMEKVPGATTATFPAECLKYDIQLTLGDGTIITYLEGNIPTYKDVSRV